MHEGKDAATRQSRPCGLSASWSLGGIGLLLFLFGVGLQFWFLKLGGPRPHENLVPDIALTAFFLALLCWVVAPFLGKRPLWLKIGVALCLVTAWSVLGYLAHQLICWKCGIPPD